MDARIAVATVVPIATPPNSKPIRRQPLLFTARTSDPRLKSWCGLVAVATIRGADIADVRCVIKAHRYGGTVKGTNAGDLQHAFRHYGHKMEFLADLRRDPPTLASWARERADMREAYVLVLKGHWVVVRGTWFCDTFTRGVPVKIKDSPHRRKRVRLVYRVTAV